jgi:hypothetical protein
MAVVSGLAIVYYEWHNATQDARLLAALPEFLIDNTPAGLWHSNCDSAKFQAVGIHVFSYITCSYGTYDLNTNLAYIDAIAAEGTYGVFADEASLSATAYNQALYDRCQAKGLKLILNPGSTEGLNADIYTAADFVMTDEQYAGRAPVAIEAANLAQTIVIGTGCTTASQAATRTQAAWANGFAYSWHELSAKYASLPDYFEDYLTLLGEGKTVPGTVDLTSTDGVVLSDSGSFSLTINPSSTDGIVVGDSATTQAVLQATSTDGLVIADSGDAVILVNDTYELEVTDCAVFGDTAVAQIDMQALVTDGVVVGDSSTWYEGPPAGPSEGNAYAYGVSGSSKRGGGGGSSHVHDSTGTAKRA